MAILYFFTPIRNAPNRVRDSGNSNPRHEVTFSASKVTNCCHSSREVSSYYDPHYNRKKYSYRLAFKRF